MVLNVGDDFGELLNIRWLQINQIKRKNIVIHVPEINAKIICREEGFTVGGDTHAVNIIIMTILELLLLNGLIPLINRLTLWQDDLAVRADGASGGLPMYLILKLPQLYNPIVG